MYTFHKLERKDYKEVFETTPFRREGIDPVEASLNSTFQPEGMVARYNGKVAGAMIVDNYGIREDMANIKAVMASKPTEFSISFWKVDEFKGNHALGMRLLESLHKVIRDGDTSLFFVLAKPGDTGYNETLKKLYMKINKDVFERNGILYLQNLEGKINEGKKK